MQLTNNLLHTIILQTLSTIQVYLTGCIIFAVKGKDRKYILMISILKCLIYNVLSNIIYEQHMGIDMRVIGIINIVLLMFNFSVIKILIGIGYFLDQWYKNYLQWSPSGCHIFWFMDFITIILISVATLINH